ncbi:MAG: membrane dipeptidase, partial [Spirochaetia bacterium]|nr:membrane dipeptidase [Spirochaetia bacterium]
MTEQSEDFFVIDAHCDTLMALNGRSMNKKETDPRDFFADNPDAHIDLPKLLRGNVRCQVMAIFLEDNQLANAPEETMHMIDIFDEVCKKSNGAVCLATNAAEVRRAINEKKLSALLSIEGAEALGSSLDMLDTYYGRGVRAIGITWNRRNAFGRGLRGEGEGGLTPLGKQLVEKMQVLHMLIDVAHLSEEGFWEVADIAKGPFIASHANARAVLDHPRNLTDAQIRAIADHGGAIGCVFVPSFIAKDPNDSNLEAFLLHVEQVV